MSVLSTITVFYLTLIQLPNQCLINALINAAHWCTDHGCPGSVEAEHIRCLEDRYKCPGVKLVEHNFIKFHNTLRNKIASGKYGRWPRAANMRQLIHSLDLEGNAKALVNMCLKRHSSCVITHEYSNVVINHSVVVKENKNATVEEMWNELIKPLDTFPVDTGLQSYSNGTWVNATQVIWATTQSVGCAMGYYTDNNSPMTILACYYAPRGSNVGVAVYDQGEPCTHCPYLTRCRESSEYSFLCAEEDDPLTDHSHLEKSIFVLSLFIMAVYFVFS